MAPVRGLNNTETDAASLDFELVLTLNGTNSLKFLPLGDTTSVSMTSTWPSPSFFGNYLPESRVVEEDGFSADWQVSSLGRAIPSRWIGDDVNEGVAMESAFGVSLFLPIGLYQLTTRAAKYAVLFVAMTFVAYFLFEIIVGLSLHPLQYLLVGLANTMFFLLLLSLAEHIGFAWAYFASAVASSALITAYSIAVLGQRTRAFIMTTVLGVLYGFLYLTLNAESYAMLAGSAALWITLAIVMYLTRHVDWHGHGGSATDSASGQAGENV
jgi:inner membrane protein